MIPPVRRRGYVLVHKRKVYAFVAVQWFVDGIENLLNRVTPDLRRDLKKLPDGLYRAMFLRYPYGHPVDQQERYEIPSLKKVSLDEEINRLSGLGKKRRRGTDPYAHPSHEAMREMKINQTKAIISHLELFRWAIDKGDEEFLKRHASKGSETTFLFNRG
jgi:hypothetical protein